VIGIWLKERYERRKDAQAWFEESYIAGGIDPLMTHLASVSNQLIGMRVRVSVNPRSFSPLSFDTVTRVAICLRTVNILGAINALEFFISNTDVNNINVNKLDSEIDQRLDLISDYLEILDDVREEFLLIRVNHKREIYNIATNPKVKALATKLDNRFSKYMRDNSSRPPMQPNNLLKSGTE
jgi:hypothetical protein